MFSAVGEADGGVVAVVDDRCLVFSHHEVCVVLKIFETGLVFLKKDDIHPFLFEEEEELCKDCWIGSVDPVTAVPLQTLCLAQCWSVPATSSCAGAVGA